MVAILLILMFSISWAFGFAMQHPGVSYWIPVGYTVIVVIGMMVPSVFEYFMLRRTDDEYSGGRCRPN